MQDVLEDGNWTQAQLAQQLGVSQELLARLIAGEVALTETVAGVFAAGAWRFDGFLACAGGAISCRGCGSGGGCVAGVGHLWHPLPLLPSTSTTVGQKTVSR